MPEQHDPNIPASEQSSESERFYWAIRKGSEAIATHGAAGQTVAV